MQTQPIYKTAKSLGISENIRQGLIQLSRDLADGTIPPERFDMLNRCGTACCIGGHLAERGVIIQDCGWVESYPALRSTFFPDGPAIVCTDAVKGAQAIVNFLVTGDPKWDDVMAAAT